MRNSCGLFFKFWCALAFLFSAQCIASQSIIGVSFLSKNGTNLSVRTSDGLKKTFELSPEAAQAANWAKVEVGDRIVVEFKDGRVVSISRAGGESIFSYGLETSEQSRVNPGMPKNPHRPSVGDKLDPSSVEKPTIYGSAQGGLSPRSGANVSSATQQRISELEGLQTQQGQPHSASQGKQPGQSQSGNLTNPGPNSNLMSGGWVREAAGWLWSKIASDDWKDDNNAGSGGNGVRGYCPETSDLCVSTGKTWDQLTQGEKVGLCQEMYEKRKQFESAPGTQTVAKCSGSAKEPEWRTIFNIKVGSQILTTESQGRQVGNTGQAVPKTGGPQSVIINSLKDPNRQQPSGKNQPPAGGNGGPVPRPGER